MVHLHRTQHPRALLPQTGYQICNSEVTFQLEQGEELWSKGLAPSKVRVQVSTRASASGWGGIRSVTECILVISSEGVGVSYILTFKEGHWGRSHYVVTTFHICQSQGKCPSSMSLPLYGK